MGAIQTTKVLAFASGTISSTAVTMTGLGFTAEQLRRSSMAFISIDTNALRFRYDGTAPTASVGHMLQIGGLSAWIIEGAENIAKLQFIRVSSDATVQVTLEGRDAN